jgi:branched-chain amino acid transport system substrate-binding protein
MRRGPLLGVVLALALLVLSPPPATAASSPASGNGAPGVTATQITTGAISTLSGQLATDLDTVVPGVRAYFDTINAEGGIDGRKLNLGYSLDDGGNPSQFTSLVHDLVDQDHVFAVTGIATDFFSPGYLAETGTPTYGFNTTGGWAGPSNLFGSDGSVQCYTCLAPHIAYVIKKTKAKSVALLAYNVSASSALCATADRLLTQAGVKVSYEDLSAPIDGNMAPDVQRIKEAGSDFVVSCMDLTGNITLTRAIHQYGVKASQLWFNGYDQSAIDQYQSIMQGIYFFVPTVPLAAPLKYYPGLAAYLSAMRKYEPQYVDSALAPEGWIAAALFVQGVKAAGNDLTQQRVVQLTNQITNFNGAGMTAPTTLVGSHSDSTATPPKNYPICAVTTQVQGTTLRPVFGKGHQVFVCLAAGAVKNPVPLTPPPGTPGT